MAKTAMTSAQPSMLKSAVTLWMKVTDPESAMMTGYPSVPIGLFLATRLAALGVAYVAIAWPGAAGNQTFLDALCRQGCAAAAQVARTGYTDAASTAVFPIPMLIAKLALLAGAPAALGLVIVSNLATLAAFLVLYRIFQRLGDELTALWGVALLALFPFSLFQVTGNPDGLALLFSALAILYGLKGYYARAGLAAAVGVLVDPFVVFAAFGVAALIARDRGAAKVFNGKSALGLFLPLAAFAGYCAYSAITFGNPFAFAAAGGRPIGQELLAGMGQTAASRGLFGTALAAALITVGAVCLVLRRAWFPLMAFALPWVFVMWTFARGGLGSHAATCWPAFLPLGAWLSRRPSLQMPAVGAFAIFFGAFLLLYARSVGLE